MYDKLKQMDAKELDLPETVFIRDIESKVFQAIVLKCLSKIEGVGLMEHNLFDSLLGRELERIKGIHIEQDQKRHSVNIRVEINIAYGISIPEKAEEVQNKIAHEVSVWTGLHVSCVHVVFKNLLSPQSEMEQREKAGMISQFADKMAKSSSDEYGEAF
ncbi:MAG TPA: Asp23/Gls24 family envelope stress response protein [Chlamydiales bacterium]|nr:Asp23/Gls24 family envelope stress response protein [Chlamydiales bacterium]